MAVISSDDDSISVVEADWQTQTRVLQGCYNVPPWNTNNNKSNAAIKRIEHRRKRQAGKTVLQIKPVSRVTEQNPQKSNISALKPLSTNGQTVRDESFASSTECMAGGVNSAKDDSR